MLRLSGRPTEGNLLQFERAICAASDNKRRQFRRRHGHSTCFRPPGGATVGSRSWRWQRRQRDGASVQHRDATTLHLPLTQRAAV